MNHTMIELVKLEAAAENVRRTATKAALEELKASILAHGLMQNLVITEAGEGRYRVIAGGRRLDALRELQAEGELPENHAVACQVVADDRAAELSLAENTVRQAMHPADEFEAFARLINAGESTGRIAERFGVSTRHVEQRLKLARLAPELLNAYRAQALTLDCLMAFTITDDHEKQLAVYASLRPWQESSPQEIRSLLAEEMLEADSKLARFVGLDAYHAAGGVSHADLFGEEVYLDSPDLLHRLAAEKLEAAQRDLQAEGWKWVEASADRNWEVIHACGRIRSQPLAVPPELAAAKQDAEAEIEEIERALGDTESDALIDALDDAEARLAEIDEQLEAFAGYDADAMRAAGCYVSIGQDGELSVEKGLVRRDDRKQLADDDGNRPARSNAMPEALRRDLESYRLQAAQVELARHPLVALDLLAFTVARSVMARRPLHGGPDVQFARQSPTPTVQKEPTTAGDALIAIAENLPTAWLHLDAEAEQFQAFLGLSERDRLALLAYGVAVSLRPQLSTGREDTACELALSMTDADMAGYWRPTRSNYLGRVTRDQLLTLGRSLLGEPWANARVRAKKGELADALERAFAEPGKHARNPEQREALARWLPEGMAFGAGTPLPEEAAQRLAA